MKKVINFKEIRNKIIFIPLGGSDEIGMNLNLYHCNEQWIIIDLGLGFQQSNLVGINIIIPDIDFIIEKIKNDIIGIILTHAHEDHIGAVQYLWSQIRCPIYATKFTLSVLKSKCENYKLNNKIKFIEFFICKPFVLGVFKITPIPIAHSIPEMSALIIDVNKNRILHTGDWKFDNNPIIGTSVNKNTLIDIGRSQILALVGDSTNVFHEKRSRSENELGKNLQILFAYHSNVMILVTTFASNIARLFSIVYAAQKVNRKVILQGKSLWKMYISAKKSGYLQDIIIYDEKHFKRFARNNMIIICTGCQGETLAVINKIAQKMHSQISFKENDIAVFSSKVIPGNEKNIYNLFNKIAQMNVHLLTEKNEFVHVSGHPSSMEIKKMFLAIKPKIAIPVHGEAKHINEHCKIAKNLGIKNVISVRNGDVIIIDNKKSGKIGKVGSGRYIIDGNSILNAKSTIINTRKTLGCNGALFISILLNKTKDNISQLHISAPGVLEKNLDQNIFNSLKLTILKNVKKESFKDAHNINNIIKIITKNYVQQIFDKLPIIIINILNM